MDFSLSGVSTEDFLQNLTNGDLDQYLLNADELKQEFDEHPHPEVAPYVQQAPPPPPPSEEQLQLNVPSQVLCNDFAGAADFEVYINPHHGKKSPWMYSSALGKIFITMNQVFPVDFKCKFPPDGGRLFVRATPVYSDAQHKHQMVMRCANHAAESDSTNQGIPEGIRDHIVRCQDRHTKYGGSQKERQHLYARVPLQPPACGSDSRQLHFQFMCKNSCASERGMNRRAIEVVFALEDEAGATLGRRALKVRICSCPKRDKGTEERTFHHVETVDAPPHAKRRKAEKRPPDATDARTWCRLEVNVPGAATARAVLHAAHGVVASQLMLKKGEPALLKKCLEEIELKLNAPLE